MAVPCACPGSRSPDPDLDPAVVKRYLPWVVATALFMEQLDSTIVNTAVPSMAVSLGVTPLSLKAVVTSYILSLAVGIPISGWIADRYGTRRVFAFAVALFTVASVLCGLALNVPMLVAARILQGFGAAMMTPVGRLAIIRTFAKSELLVAMNFVIVPALIGPLLGPTVGGLIVHWFSWRDIFFVNVPMGIAALWIIARHMPDYRGDAPRKLDVVGLVLFGTGTALLSWLLEIFGEHNIDITSAGVLFLLVAVRCSEPTRGTRARSAIRCCSCRCSTCAPSASRWSAVSSRGWASADCRSCCRCCSSWAWDCRHGSRAC